MAFEREWRDAELARPGDSRTLVPGGEPHGIRALPTTSAPGPRV